MHWRGSQRLEAFAGFRPPDGVRSCSATSSAQRPERRRHQASQWTATLTICSRPTRPSVRAQPLPCAVQRRAVWSLQEARDALERLIGSAGDWSRLDEYLISYLVEPAMRATVFASSLAATLELVREGQIEVHQQSAFAPIYLRKRDASGNAAPGSNATLPRAID